MVSGIIHKQLSYLINGCIFDVHNAVGPGLREECYQKGTEHRMRQTGIPFVAKPDTRTEFVYKGVVVDVFETDMLVSDRIIAELKHQPEGFVRANFTQVLSYLKFWDLRLGMLINFAMDRAIIERIAYTPRIAVIDEDYRHISHCIDGRRRSEFEALRAALHEINQSVGLGYATPTYRNLAIVAMRSHGLVCEADIVVTPKYQDHVLPRSPITPLLVQSSVCVQVEALYDDISARAIRTMQTHLRLTGCPYGIIVGFGKTKFMIRGVRP